MFVGDYWSGIRLTDYFLIKSGLTVTVSG